MRNISIPVVKKLSALATAKFKVSDKMEFVGSVLAGSYGLSLWPNRETSQKWYPHRGEWSETFNTERFKAPHIFKTPLGHQFRPPKVNRDHKPSGTYEADSAANNNTVNNVYGTDLEAVNRFIVWVTTPHPLFPIVVHTFHRASIRISTYACLSHFSTSSSNTYELGD